MACCLMQLHEAQRPWTWPEKDPTKYQKLNWLPQTLQEPLDAALRQLSGSFLADRNTATHYPQKYKFINNFITYWSRIFTSPAYILNNCCYYYFWIFSWRKPNV